VRKSGAVAGATVTSIVPLAGCYAKRLMFRIRYSAVWKCSVAGVAISLFAQNAGTLSDQYRDVASRLIDASLADQGGMQKLSYLCDRIGHRLSGSPALEKAVAWAAAQMKADGLSNVVTPRVRVPHWVRGNESASLLEPVNKPLSILGLGGSVATPKRGITAEVVPVSSFEDLDKKGRAAVEGKI